MCLLHHGFPTLKTAEGNQKDRRKVGFLFKNKKEKAFHIVIFASVWSNRILQIYRMSKETKRMKDVIPLSKQEGKGVLRNHHHVCLSGPTVFSTFTE